MITKELLDFIENIDKKLREKYKGNDFDKKWEILSSTVKLSEEVWELSSEVLISLGRARQKKLDNSWIENLEWEFSDVIFATLFLANKMWVDINKAIRNKLEKIEKRGV